MSHNYMEEIKASFYSTPSNYKESVNYFTNSLQSKINDKWKYAPNNYEIEEENIFGTFEFSNIICRICSAISPKTGKNLGDDFKELKFFDLNYEAKMGKRYRFEDSIWITTNTSNCKNLTKSAIVRRCNNVLKWVDIDGNVIVEPCIIDYSLLYSNVYFNDTLYIPQGSINVICQDNIYSKTININNRFIFDSQVFKSKSMKDYLRQKTFEKGSSSLIEIQMYLDTKKAGDNFDLQLAASDNEIIQKPSGTNIVVSPDISSILQGETIEFSCYSYIDNVKQNEEFEFQFDGVPSIYYEYTIVDGNHFIIKNIKFYRNNNLIVKCKGTDNYKEMSIKLNGLY